MTTQTFAHRGFPQNATRDAVWRAPAGSGGRELGIASIWACVAALPMLGIGGSVVYRDWSARRDARTAANEAALAHERLLEAAPAATLPLAEATHGRDVFATACVACHGPAGTGIEGLGKNLATSDFVTAQTDEELVQFVVTGRPNARPTPMPPRAGREDLTDADLRHVAVYLRGLQDARRMPALPPMVLVAAPISDADKAAALAAAGGDAELAGYIASGNKLFHTTCIACHGKGGVGIAGNGKALVNNQFVQSLNDDGLLAFVKRGRDPSDPKNTTGIGMPARGGNPALSEDDLLDIISYVRTLQNTKTPATAGK